MTTGSLCLTEILMSRKSCSSNSEHSHSADSTSASGVALPYLAMIRLSRLPALTPIRIGVPLALAARATSPTLPSNSRMLPGLTRTAAQPRRSREDVLALEVDVGDHRDLRLLDRPAAAPPRRPGPARDAHDLAAVAVSAAICCSVALTSR
jgi:hypothetical protein